MSRFGSSGGRGQPVLLVLAVLGFAFWALWRFFRESGGESKPSSMSWLLAGIAAVLLSTLVARAIGRARAWSPKGIVALTLALSMAGLVGAVAWVGPQADSGTATTAAYSGGPGATTSAPAAAATTLAPLGTTLPTATTTTGAVVRRDLVAAIDQGLVQAEFRALGGASGDIVELLIERLTDLDLEITVPPGLMLNNPAGGEQDLVVAGLEGRMTGANTYEPADTISLDDDSLPEYLLEAYCAEAHEANPSAGGTLTIGELAAGDLQAVLRAAANRSGSTLLVQAVVWVITDDVTAADLDAVGYGLDAGEVADAREIITAAGLDPGDYRLFAG